MGEEGGEGGLGGGAAVVQEGLYVVRGERGTWVVVRRWYKKVCGRGRERVAGGHDLELRQTRGGVCVRRQTALGMQWYGKCGGMEKDGSRGA